MGIKLLTDWNLPMTSDDAIGIPWDGPLPKSVSSGVYL